MRQSSFGAFIRTLRLRKGLTQAQLANRLGVTDKAVSKWERGISFPDLFLFQKLADVFGISVGELLEQCTEEGQPSQVLQIFEMSHDIRTPLHMILGCADLAKTHYEDRERTVRYLESIRISGEYLLSVLNRLMTAGGAGTERMQTEGFPENVSELGDYLKEQTASQESGAAKPDFSGKRILVAEDMELNREIAGEILRQTNAHVEFAQDGQICLQMVKKAPAGYYDLILMDLMMPNMDGIRATREIRQLEDKRKAKVPIIAMTANVHERDRKAAFDAGMNDFAEKPIFMDRLFKTLKHYLDEV